MELKVARLIVLTGLPGTDIVSIELDAPTPFPEMGYPAIMKIDVRKGYGVTWCRNALGAEPHEVIDASFPGGPKPADPRT